MPQPKKPCGACAHYHGAKLYGGPRTYGSCSLKQGAVHANSRGCDDWVAAPCEFLLSLSRQERDVAREALAVEASTPEWNDADIKTIETVIAKLEVLGAEGTL